MLLEKKNRIIAGFSGVGKTTFCNQNQNAIDLICEPFKYENYMELKIKYKEQILRIYQELRLRDDWMFLYYDVLRSIYRLYPEKIIVTPIIYTVLNWLEKDEIAYALVYPSSDLKEEYKQRYAQCGNLNSVIHILDDDWEYQMAKIRLYENTERIELKPGQYLSDVILSTNYDKHNIIEEEENLTFTYFKRQTLRF